MEEAASYQQRISERIDGIHMLAGDGNPSRSTSSNIKKDTLFGYRPRRTVSFNKGKCRYLAQELATKIQSNIATKIQSNIATLLAAKGDTVGPVLRHIAFAVEAAEHLVERSCEEKWWNEIFWMGDSTEAFGDVLLNLQAAMDIAIGKGSCTDRSISRSRSELGQEWKSMVLQDRSSLECNVRLVIQQRFDPAYGNFLHNKDLEIANHVQAKLGGTYAGNVIQLGVTLIFKGIAKGITCITWHGKKCVLKRFESDELAKREADIMKDLMHPHIVLLFGYALRRRYFGQPSVPNILLQYAERGDLREYIKKLDNDLEVDVIVNVMLEIAKGMHHIHSKKIAHLDLKSMNVFVTSHTIADLHAANFFHVKIGDLGTAIRCNDGPIPDSRVYGQGTHRWRAPELFKEAPRSDLDLFKADVYSYAMVCVELVTRQLPLQERFPDQLNRSELYAYVSQSSNRPSLPETYPPELLSIIRCCWDAEPSKRPSFEDIIESLDSLKGEMLLNDKFYSALPKVIQKNKKDHHYNFYAQAGSTQPPDYNFYAQAGWTQPPDYNFYAQEGKGTARREPPPDSIFGGPAPDYKFGGPPREQGVGGGSAYEVDANIFGQGVGGGRVDELDEMLKKATMSPIFVIQTIHPPFSAEGWEMLIELGEDVRRKIDDFVHGGATMGQQMYTSRASHLQPILSEFQEQLHLLSGHAHDYDTTRNELFNEVFHVLKRVEFLLGSCSWPALEFHGGPTATDEAFLSMWKNLGHCVQMMRYSSTLLRATDALFEEISKFRSENPNEDSWSRACESDRQMLLRFLYSCVMMYRIDQRHHWYMGSIAVISKDSAMYSEGPAAFNIPLQFVRRSDNILWDEGPNGLIMGPMPFLGFPNVEKKEVYHQLPVYWAVKVYARECRKLAYDFIKLASLQHPHVVQMFGAWEDGDSGYVAMKMMQTNVMQFLSQKQDNTLSAVLLLTILVQIAEGMSYMHSHHVRHHNLKCSNVLLGGFYKNLEIVHVEISDFWFDRGQVSEEDRDLESSSSSTVPIKDTVQFGEGEETDEYAFDVYQFAMLCSEIFSIRGTREASEALAWQATGSDSGEIDDEAVTVSFPEKCPRELAMYLQKCGSKDPNQRPKFAEICTVLCNYRAYMILSGDQGTGSAARE